MRFSTRIYQDFAFLSGRLSGRFEVEGQGPIPEGPYTLTMELGPKKTIPILVLGT